MVTGLVAFRVFLVVRYWYVPPLHFGGKYVSIYQWIHFIMYLSCANCIVLG